MDSEKELWGHKFKIVNNGLDEGQVYSFVESLSNQYGQFSRRLEELDSAISKLAEGYTALADKLDVRTGPGDPATQHPSRHQAEDYPQTPGISGNGSDNTVYSNGDRLAYLDSLTRFAESTVIEATKQSLRIKSEMEEKAKIKAASIVAQAKEKAQAEVERIVGEAQAEARTRANEILVAAEQKANSLLQSAGHDAETIRSRCEGVESIAAEADPAFVQQAREQLSLLVRVLHSEQQRLLSSGKKPGESEIKNTFSTILESMGPFSELVGEVSLTAEPESAEEEPEPDEGKRAPAHENKKGAETLFEGTVELALPPPVGLDRMLQLHKHLKQTPNVDVLNLGGSVDKGITIRVHLENPTALLKIIAELPEVSGAAEEEPGSTKVVPGRKDDGSQIKRIIVNTKT
ncbi:MAG: hypothetical protein IBX68_02495 [Dehalococcoidia bacterium]|nr:hypothetical protein [Dehalococcoidia bacterium]